MSKLVSVLNKALSTNSEDEAIACLRMARKTKQLIPEQTTTATVVSDKYKGYSAKEWYTVAVGWKHKYNTEIGSQDIDYKYLYEYYDRAYHQTLNRNNELTKKILTLHDKEVRKTGFFTLAIIALNLIYLLLLAYL